MFLVSQDGRKIVNARALEGLKLNKHYGNDDALIKCIFGDMRELTIAEYSCKELAELDFRLLQKAIEAGDKIFYFSREEVEEND